MTQYENIEISANLVSPGGLVGFDTVRQPFAHDTSTPAERPLRVRRFERDQSIFFDSEYVIKGVAGSVLWRMLSLFIQEGRTEFSNRELRLDPQIPLPDVADNLESRLILLTRRLKARAAAVQLEKAGRGRLRLRIERSLALQSIATG